ncbi:MAG: hypothetical protein GX939_06565 [Clostridiaceae bacterium]|jgi:23S rRNA maturation mini-RNase III|nr:hypothetical protein [Clostridiaceae bacterium]
MAFEKSSLPPDVTSHSANRYSVTTLAWIGDAVFELRVRLRLAKIKPHISSGALHYMAIRYVSARGQAMMLRKLLDESSANNKGSSNISLEIETVCESSSLQNVSDDDTEYCDVFFDDKAKHAFHVSYNHDDAEPNNIDVVIDNETQDTTVRLEEKAIVFSEREMILMRRARNHHTDSQPKNVDIRDYHLATAFETLIGWLWLTDQKTRMYHIIDRALAIMDIKQQ